MSDSKQLGVSVGPIGRTIRLLIGICTLLWTATDFFSTSHDHNVLFFVLMFVSFFTLTLAYTLVHLLFANTLFRKSPIYATLIFVLPMLYMIIAPEIDASQQFGHWFGYPQLNHPFRIALLIFLGVSFIIQWFDKYGGCEVVAIPNFLFRKNYGSYCLPILPIDILERKISRNKD